MKIKTLGMVVAASLVAWGSKRATAEHAAPHIEGKMVVQVIGEVRAIDPVARRVTVANAQGAQTQLNVGPDMHDLDKLPLGTRVKSSALQPVTLTPVRHGKLQEAIPGDKRFVVQVTSVDAATGVVMLKDADNLPIEVRVGDPRRAAALASGTAVQVDVLSRQQEASQKKH